MSSFAFICLHSHSSVFIRLHLPSLSFLCLYSASSIFILLASVFILLHPSSFYFVFLDSHSSVFILFYLSSFCFIVFILLHLSSCAAFIRGWRLLIFCFSGAAFNRGGRLFEEIRYAGSQMLTYKRKCFVIL